ncbi:MAG: TonB-dependent receptor [Acidobacteriota bacterium]
MFSGRKKQLRCGWNAVWTSFLWVSLMLCAGAALAVDGRVVDGNGEPVEGATVRARAAAGATAVATTASDGRFELADLSGAVRLEVEASGFRPRSLRVSAQATDVEVDLTRLTARGEIVVTAAMPELATEVDVPGSEMERGGGDLAEAMRGLNGVAAKRRGAINLEPSIRGLQEEQVGLFVDGTRTFPAGPARMDSGISHVGPHAIDTVRVVKGPYALTWGAGTMSALELVTSRPAFSTGGLSWQGRAGGAWSDNGDRADGYLSVGAGSERWRFLVNGGYRTGDDYEDGDGAEVPGDYESTDLRWHLGWQPTDSWLVEYLGGYQQQNDIDYPGRLLDATYFHTRSHAVSASKTGGDTFDEVYVQAYRNLKNHRMNNDEKPTAQPAPGRIPPFGLRVDLPTEADTSGARARFSLIRGAVEWSFGGDLYRTEQMAERRIFRRSNDFLIFTDNVWPEATIEDLGGWAQAVWVGARTQVGATVRIDAVESSADDLTAFYLANTVGDPDQDDTHVSAAISAAFEVQDGWSLTVGAGRTVRTPSVLELYSDRFPATKFQIAAELMGNPQLVAEEALELNIGSRARFGDVLLQVDLFYRTIDDYITIVPDPTLPRRLPLSPQTVYRYVNGEADFWGGELRLDHRVNRNVAWHIALDQVRGEDTTFDEPAFGTPPFRATLGAQFLVFDGRLSIDVEGRFVDDQDRVATSRFESPTEGYELFDVMAAWRLTPELSLSAGVFNLTDEAYTDHLNSPSPFTRQRIFEPGQSARIALDFRF